MADARTERLRAAAADLRAAAHGLLRATDLLRLLRESVGEPILHGSVALDLMVWPDIDIHVALAPDEGARMQQVLPVLCEAFEGAGHRVRQATYLDDYVPPGPHPLGAGIYCGIQTVERSGAERHWKCDVWGWEPADFRGRTERFDAMGAALAKTDRDLVLRLKAEARARPGCYGEKVFSVDVYDFAIAGAGETLDGLEAFAAARRPPA
jgi:hypothetical protein